MAKKDSKISPIKVDSIEDAEKIIYEKINQGTNTRDIVKIEIDINGILKKFNPYQIKKIKEKFEIPKNDNRNTDKAVLFELFEKGVDVINAVIQTKLDPKFVNEVWIEYLEIKNICTISKSSYDQLFQRGKKIKSECNTIDDVLTALDDGFIYLTELNKFYFPCRVCKCPVIIDDQIINQTIRWMQSKWLCSDSCEQEEQN